MPTTYTITETIHHGTYFNQRTIETSSIGPDAIRAIVADCVYLTQMSDEKIERICFDLDHTGQAEIGWVRYSVEVHPAPVTDLYPVEVEDNDDGSRSYVVGLPVVVTVHADGSVSVSVDMSEASEGMSEDDGATIERYSDAVIDADVSTVDAAWKSNSITNVTVY